MFKYRRNKTEIKICKYIGKEASVVIPDNIKGELVTEIGGGMGLCSIGAFRDCHDITSVTIPESVTRLGWFTFFKCLNLTHIVIPKGVTTIESCTFYRCSSLTSVIMEGSMQRIEKNAFSDCGNLVELQVGEGSNYQTMEGVLFSQDGKTLLMCPGGREGVYQVPDGVMHIDEFAFADCGKLTHVIIPESVIRIGDCAFTRCFNLAKVEMPARATKLGTMVFPQHTQVMKRKGSVSGG